MPNLITSDIATSVSIVATAGQTVFSFAFPFFDAADILVDINGTYTTAFTLSGAGSATGGAVTLLTAATAGQVITIQRDVLVKRSIDLPATGPVNMENVDAEFDRLFAITQQLKSGINRSLRFGVTETTLPVFPSIATRASKILSFDAAGQISMITTSAGAAATITVGSVTTLAAGSSAIVTNVGTSSAAVFNFSIPQGDGAGFTTEQIQDIVGAMMVASTGMTVTYNDPAGTVTFLSTTAVADGSVTLPKLANINTSTFIGRVTAAAGVPEALTATQATSILNVGTTLLKGLVPAPGSSIPHAFLRGDLTWAGVEMPLIVAASDEITALTVGVAKVTFRAPYACNIIAVRASLTVAQVAGVLLTVDVNKSGATVLSTKLTFDNAERTTVTALTPPLLSSTTLTSDEEVSIDIDQIGDGSAKGLKVTLLLQRTA